MYTDGSSIWDDKATITMTGSVDNNLPLMGSMLDQISTVLTKSIDCKFNMEVKKCPGKKRETPQSTCSLVKT